MEELGLFIKKIENLNQSIDNNSYYKNVFVLYCSFLFDFINCQRRCENVVFCRLKNAVFYR